MKFSTILYRAAQYRAARYILALALAALAAVFGMSDAKAADVPPCTNTSVPLCNQGQAYTVLKAFGNSSHCGNRTWVRNEVAPTSGGRYGLTVICLLSGQDWPFGTSYTTFYGSTCASKPSVTSIFMPQGGAQQCNDGCLWTYMQNADDTTSTRSPTGGVCTGDEACPTGFYRNTQMRTCDPIEPECGEGQRLLKGQCVADETCPEGMITAQPGTAGAIASGALYCKPAENECPAGNIKAPSGQCLPGEGQCAAGEARKPDGTCGKDANGDGVADDIADDGDPTNDSFSGGDNCTSPPACSGNPILCGQARIQWRIECNTRKNVNISGGSCSAAPVCTGEKCNAMEYSQLLMQWRTACALEKAAGDTGGEEGGDSTAEWLASQAAANKGEADALANAGDGHEGVSEGDIWGDGVAGSISETLLGSGAGGTCSANTWSLLGNPIELPGDWWNLASWIGFLLVALSYIWVGWRLM